MKRPVRILLTVVAVIAVIVCVFCILFIVQYVRGKSVSDKLGSGVRSGQVVEPLDPQDDGKYMAINVDFDSLHDVNPEIYAWIEVPGTNINYPVVQTNNNSKYLNTLFDGTANASGAIFLDSDDTAPGMVDQQTTIYGHHMNDGSMFNVISRTTDQATFDSMEYVYYITCDATYKLRPLATKVVEDTYAKARTPNFEGDDGLKNYLSEMLDGASAVASDATDRAASATKVVTLVTCRSLSLSNTRAVMVLTPVEE